MSLAANNSDAAQPTKRPLSSRGIFWLVTATNPEITAGADRSSYHSHARCRLDYKHTYRTRARRPRGKQWYIAGAWKQPAHAPATVCWLRAKATRVTTVQWNPPGKKRGKMGKRRRREAGVLENERYLSIEFDKKKKLREKVRGREIGEKIVIKTGAILFYEIHGKDVSVSYGAEKVLHKALPLVQ